MRTLAVLPVKSFGLAKQRLGAAVGGDERRALARAMVGDVLEALGRVRGLDGVLVVTPEALMGEAGAAAKVPAPAAMEDAADGGPRAAAFERVHEPLATGGGPRTAAFERVHDPLATGGGPRTAAFERVHDPLEAGQSAAALLGIRAALARGAERVLLVPGDCPALDPAEVGGLLADREPGVVIVPDRHGTGTNALLLAPPGALEPAFGPGSFERHAALAGAGARVAEVPSLGLDVDTPGDLAALREALTARPGGAPRTRALLDGIAAAHAA